MVIICEDKIHITPTLPVSYKLVRRQLENFKVHSFWDTDFPYITCILSSQIIIMTSPYHNNYRI